MESADPVNSDISTTEHNRRTHALILASLVRILSWFIALPLFLFLHKILLDPDWAFHLDRIVLLILVFGLIAFLLKLIRNIVFILFIISLLGLAAGSFSGGYGFADFFYDYKNLVTELYNSRDPQKVLLNKLVLFPNRNELLSAIDANDSKVREFALKAIAKHFVKEQKDPEYRQLVQCLAVFKEINSRWVYVNDPKDKEYYATAGESVKLLAGDCDDHSILMAACIKSIGGTPRLIHADGHLYPELKIGNKKDLQKINDLIKNSLFIRESEGKSIHFHTDPDGQVWLNMDYTGNYPGSRFLTEKNLGVINL